jgi:hypothetical protein
MAKFVIRAKFLAGVTRSAGDPPSVRLLRCA